MINFNTVAKPLLACCLAASIASCDRTDPPSDKVKEVIEGAVEEVAGSEPVALPQGKYAPRNECANIEGSDVFLKQLSAAVQKRDATALVTLASPEIKLDFGGGSGRETLRKRLNEPDG
ncbi:MAG: hypothetical protein WAT93_15220 [Pontixanthobacter sp.]